MSTIFGKKISQLPPVSTAIANGLLAIVQNGKTWYITFNNLLKNYYNKAEIDQKFANLEIGGVTTTTKVIEDLSINANQTKEFTHGLNTQYFTWVFQAWSQSHNQYIQVQSAPPEVTRSATTITLNSLLAYPQFRLMFQTYDVTGPPID